MSNIFALFETIQNSSHIVDISKKVHDEFNKAELKRIIKHNDLIGIAVGSRFIKCQKAIIDQLITELLIIGARPIIIPAMGSHGSSTAKGQMEILMNYGLNYEEMNVPICSSMDTIRVSTLSNGLNVYFDKKASECDGIILINRIKEHTALSGSYQSGLLKILAVGLGKRIGAKEIHKYGINEYLIEVGILLINKMPIIAGIGIIENAFQEPFEIIILNNEDILIKEPDLLEIAKRNTQKIPFNNIDFLILSEIGKDISGTCLDLNVVERGVKYKDVTIPKIKTIIALDLTNNSQGNATGIGYVDIITDELYKKIDIESTYKNCVTSRHYNAGKIPIRFSNFKKIYDEIILSNKSNRILFYKNTLEMHQFFASDALSSDIEKYANIKQKNVYGEIRFDKKQNLIYPNFYHGEMI